MHMIGLGFAALLLAAAWATSGHAAAKYKEVEVSNGGTITGKVGRGAAEAENQSFTISKNPEVCGTGTRVVEWVRINGDALLDAVVYLEKVAEGKSWPENSAKMVVDQKNCAFVPYLQVGANGGKLESINSDNVAHNIHTYELIKRARRTVINVSQPEPGTVSKTIKLRKGVGMKVECDQHDFMHGFVFVARNPYYAVVDEHGEFTIDNVPPGSYVIKTWHGRLGEQESKVDVQAGASASVAFTY